VWPVMVLFSANVIYLKRATHYTMTMMRCSFFPHGRRQGHGHRQGQGQGSPQLVHDIHARHTLARRPADRAAFVEHTVLCESVPAHGTWDMGPGR